MEFFLGGPVDDPGGSRSGDDRLEYDAADLTTHGVIVGMTGSGKTGLGIIYLEEALRSGIPALVIDPKGDMTNLLLTFPGLAPDDFAPWIDPASLDQGTTVEAAAAETARRWRDGLAGWGLSGADIAALRSTAGLTIYTPGSTAGVALNVLGSLQAPGLDWETEAETLRDEIQGFTSGLLGLIGVDADPISSREHILIANLVEHAWREGRSLDMATLLAWIHRPPLRKLGVFDVDVFFPERERMDLAMRLNGLLASPAFAAWMEGAPLDIESLLWRDGKPQAAIVYLAHLSDEERQFVVALLLSKLVAWMRTQPGSGDLRVLAYMDEVFGFAPPTAQPPAKKPILTLLKQARAFGVGILLATQNPVDLDYKAMSNAGTWCIGRLQTERDKARIVEALASATGDVDVDALDRSISGLGKRVFLLHSTRDPHPAMFTTRWAMSYLRGPLTRGQIGDLMEGKARPPAAAEAEPTSQGTPVLPPAAEGTPVVHLAPAAPWAASIGADPSSTHYAAALAVRVAVRYDERRAGVDHREEWEAVLFPLGTTVDPGRATAVDYDDRDLLADPPEGATYQIGDAPIADASFFASARRAFADHLQTTSTVTVFHNPALGLYSRVGERREEFSARCEAAADQGADEAAGKLRRRYESKLRAEQRKLEQAVDRAETAAAALDAERQDQLVDQAGKVFDLLMGRGSVRSLTRGSRGARGAETRLRSAEDRVESQATRIADLESELEGELADIAAEWDDKAAEIEELEVGLESDDVTVEQVALLWVPVTVSDPA